MNIVNYEEKHKLYDQIISATLTNIYTLSKEQKEIVLNNFNPKDKNHLYFLEVAKVASQMFKMPLSLNLSYFNFLKIRFKKKYKGITRKNCFGIDITEVLSFMTKAIKIDPNIYTEIHKEYYEGA